MKYLKSFNENTIFVERDKKKSKTPLLKPTTALLDIWHKLQFDVYGTKIRELSEVRFGKTFNDYLKFVLEGLSFSLSLTDNNTTIVVKLEKDGIIEDLGDYDVDNVDYVIQVILNQLKNKTNNEEI